jgi:hypothetical protein
MTSTAQAHVRSVPAVPRQNLMSHKEQTCGILCRIFKLVCSVLYERVLSNSSPFYKIKK